MILEAGKVEIVIISSIVNKMESSKAYTTFSLDDAICTSKTLNHHRSLELNHFRRSFWPDTIVKLPERLFITWK